MRYEEEMPPEYRAALGTPGADALRKFVDGGGTLIAFGDSCDYVIDQFNIPVRNALASVKAEEYSNPGSLVRLRGYPFAAIKIDGSLVENCARDPRGAALIEALAEMARALLIPVVAEGVEDRAQLAVLRRAGVTRAQGYLLSRPLPWDGLEAAEAAMEARFRAALQA